MSPHHIGLRINRSASVWLPEGKARPPQGGSEYKILLGGIRPPRQGVVEKPCNDGNEIPACRRECRGRIYAARRWKAKRPGRMYATPTHKQIFPRRGAFSTDPDKGGYCLAEGSVGRTYISDLHSASFFPSNRADTSVPDNHGGLSLRPRGPVGTGPRACPWPSRLSCIGVNTTDGRPRGAAPTTAARNRCRDRSRPVPTGCRFPGRFDCPLTC